MGVASAAAPAAGDDRALSRLTHIRHQFTGIRIGDDGAGGHPHLAVFTALAVLLLAAAVLATAGPDQGLEFKIQQRGDSGIDDAHHIAAVAAVAAAGSAAWLVLLAQKSDTSTPAVAGMHVDLGFIDELHPRCTPRLAAACPKEKPRGPSPRMPASSGGHPPLFPSCPRSRRASGRQHRMDSRLKTAGMTTGSMATRKARTTAATPGRPLRHARTLLGGYPRGGGIPALDSRLKTAGMTSGRSLDFVMANPPTARCSALVFT